MIYVLTRGAMMACMVVSTALVADDCKGPAGGSTGGGGAVKACDTRLERPVEASRPEGTVVRVYSVSSCDAPPQKHVVHLSLEHLTGSDKNRSERGDWKPMPSYNGQAFRSCEAIPYPGSNVRCEWYVPCIVSGLYQASATITGAGPDGRAFSFTVPEKPLARIQCKG